MSQHHLRRRRPRPADGRAGAVATACGVLSVVSVLSALALLTGPASAAPRPVGRTPDPSLRLAECDLRTGPYQEEAEEHLGLPRDGLQSAADCAGIQRFQFGNGMETANGFAGVETWRMIQFARAAADRSSLKGCAPEKGVVVCVDLTRQILWVTNGGRVVYGPVPARSGVRGYATRTGRFAIYERVEEEWSDLYDSPMPFSQYFSGGQALHGSYRDIWEEPGSQGCVNLRYADAQRLWRSLRIGDTVRIWGARDS
ncbi:L,D-transpeptidase [Streptomyces sp. NPDC058171]